MAASGNVPAGELRPYGLLLGMALAFSGLPLANCGEAEAPKPAEEQPKPAEPATPTITVDVTGIATKSAAEPYEVPNQVSVVKADEIVERLQASPNFSDAFKELPGTFIQKTGQGQGSPYIRGFTGFRNLLMIDGVRFNNSTFREGPNQYWATIDPLFLDRIDVLRGPGSSLYGSDAVGGVVNAITKSTDTWSDETEVGGTAYYRTASAERSHIGHVEVKGSHKDKVGFIFGGTFSDNDDFVAGGGVGETEYTAWQAWSLNGKVQYRPVQGHELTFYVDRWRTDDSPRTEQTVFAKTWEGTARGTERRQEFDQNRLLSYLKHRWSDTGTPLVEEVETTLSYQNTMEDVYRVRANGEQRFGDFEVNTYGAQIQAKSKAPLFGVLTYGLDYFHDFIQSAEKRISAAGVTTVRIQGPVGDDGSYSLFGAYIQDEVDLFDRYLTLTGGGRFEYITVESDKFQDPDTGAAADLERDWSSFVGSLRFLVRPDLEHGDHWRVFGGVQQSFRAPSFHDLTSFDAGVTQEIPSPGVEPEEFTTYELGFKTRYGGFQAEASYYYTFIHNQLIREPTGDPGPPPVVAKRNGGKGYIYGAELGLRYTFLEDFTLWGNVTVTEGDILQYDNNVPPVRRRYVVDRLIPVMSHMGLKYEPLGERWWVELHADVFSDANRRSFGNRADMRRFPPDGTPGFGVFGIRGGVKLLDDRLRISGAIENIGNVDYRIHGSGQNMPGINAILGIQYNW
ncbi:MAG: TonB-dependent receptor [Planctomycetota bacterium]|nr:TonB-dependent receptor [Planctomycetota bacterium]